MTRYLIRRTVQVVPVLFGVSIAVFLRLRLIPGDVVDAILGSEGSASPERMAQLRAMFGLDRPLYEQYLTWVGGIVTGNSVVCPLHGRHFDLESGMPTRASEPSCLAVFPTCVEDGIILVDLTAGRRATDELAA